MGAVLLCSAAEAVCGLVHTRTSGDHHQPLGAGDDVRLPHHLIGVVVVPAACTGAEVAPQKQRGLAAPVRIGAQGEDL